MRDRTSRLRHACSVHCIKLPWWWCGGRLHLIWASITGLPKACQRHRLGALRAMRCYRRNQHGLDIVGSFFKSRKYVSQRLLPSAQYIYRECFVWGFPRLQVDSCCPRGCNGVGECDFFSATCSCPWLYAGSELNPLLAHVTGYAQCQPFAKWRLLHAVVAAICHGPLIA